MAAFLCLVFDEVFRTSPKKCMISPKKINFWDWPTNTCAWDRQGITWMNYSGLWQVCSSRLHFLQGTRNVSFSQLTKKALSSDSWDMPDTLWILFHAELPVGRQKLKQLHPRADGEQGIIYFFVHLKGGYESAIIELTKKIAKNPWNFWDQWGKWEGFLFKCRNSESQKSWPKNGCSIEWSYLNLGVAKRVVFVAFIAR